MRVKISSLFEIARVSSRRKNGISIDSSTAHRAVATKTLESTSRRGAPRRTYQVIFTVCGPALPTCAVQIILPLPEGAQKDRIHATLNPQKATIIILATLFVSLALA